MLQTLSDSMLGGVELSQFTGGVDLGQFRGYRKTPRMESRGLSACLLLILCHESIGVSACADQQTFELSCPCGTMPVFVRLVCGPLLMRCIHFAKEPSEFWLCYEQGICYIRPKTFPSLLQLQAVPVLFSYRSPSYIELYELRSCA